MERSFLQRVQNINERISTIAAIVAAVMILVIMLLTVVDVSLRKFGSGIEGYIELNGLMMVVIAFFSFGYCWYRDGHIRIDLFLDRISHRAQLAIRAFGALSGLVFFGAMVWKGIGFAFDAYRKSEVSSDLLIPLFPVKFLLVIGASIFCFQLLIAFAIFVSHVRKK